MLCIDDPRIVGALIALAGVFIGALSSWILALINRRFDDRRCSKSDFSQMPKTRRRIPAPGCECTLPGTDCYAETWQTA